MCGYECGMYGCECAYERERECVRMRMNEKKRKILGGPQLKLIMTLKTAMSYVGLITECKNVCIICKSPYKKIIIYI